MKKVLIVDGNTDERSQVAGKLGPDYDVSTVSYFDINNMALSTVVTMANTIDSLDVYSGGHSLRVAVIARDIAANLGWDTSECDNLYFVSLLHDIGMITVPDAILHKPARLNEDEYDVVKLHTSEGARILRDIDVLDHLSDAVMYHHERWDGCGYPEGLAGEDIPAVARVIALADAYDAMNSDRIYRPRMSSEKIISEFARCKGTQFDPDMTDVFIFMLREGYTVDPKIDQTPEARQNAVRDSGLADFFRSGNRTKSEKDGERDALTGLFTRSYLNTRVGSKILEARSGALMLIDIRGYDALRDLEKTEDCDRITRSFAGRLRSLFREEDIVCRLADNRYAVYVSGDSGKSVIEKKASRTSKITEDNEEFAGYRDVVGVVIGISMCMEDGVTFEELYSAAADALAEAARSGKNTYRFK